MTSPDGITWTIRTSAADNEWLSVTYGNGLFVAVSWTGTGNRVMTSGKTDYIPFSANNIYQGGMSIFGNIGIGTSTPSQIFTVATSTNIFTVNSTTSQITFTNASGTRVTAATSLDTAKVIATNVSSTNITALGYIQSATTTITLGSLVLGTSNTDPAGCIQTYVKGTTTVFWIGVNTSTYSVFATSTKPDASCN